MEKKIIPSLLSCLFFFIAPLPTLKFQIALFSSLHDVPNSLVNSSELFEPLHVALLFCACTVKWTETGDTVLVGFQNLEAGNLELHLLFHSQSLLLEQLSTISVPVGLNIVVDHFFLVPAMRNVGVTPHVLGVINSVRDGYCT